MSNKDLKEVFNSFNSDQDKWNFVRLHSDRFKIILDNDETYAELNGEWLQFSESIGSTNGVFNLLESIGLYAEYC